MDSIIGSPPDDSLGPTINIIAWMGAGVSTVFVILRLYSRLFITRAPDWDDVVIAIATIINIITIALCSMAISYGLGRHIQYLSDDDLVNCLYYSAIQRAPGILSFTLPKLSVVIFLSKLMGNMKRGRWFLYSVITILFITSLMGIVIFLAQCRPMDHLWHPLSPADCVSATVLDAISYLCGSWSAFTDIVLASFPIYLLWNLQMKPSKKISTMIVMALGFIAAIAAIAKTTQLSKNRATDATWEPFWLFISSYIESDLVIIAACAPTLPKLIKRILGKETDESAGPGYHFNKPTSQDYHPFDSQRNFILMNPV
ncbi:uncharacterized protein F4812DRAFT_462036 [Daldinia caldariorum]|uniref:uncharacterized protein n=1 Tax=Daldinia caldariorum TaxID=326644 RepID=UPI002008DEC3|nr:uncharacterized protein F4812DRAFT_462036 [Daldinia caldariorum]KAI1465193.1 hypothetical protein F4812DRAFT_462036 [Daldinia caldariorum]